MFNIPPGHQFGKASSSGSPPDSPNGSTGSSDEERVRSASWEEEYARESHKVKQFIDMLIDVCRRRTPISRGIYSYENVVGEEKPVTSHMRKVKACGVIIGVLDANGYLRQISDSEGSPIFNDHDDNNYPLGTREIRKLYSGMHDFRDMLPRYVKTLPRGQQ